MNWKGRRMGRPWNGRRIWRSVKLAVGAATVILAVAATCEEEPRVDCGYLGVQKESVCEFWRDGDGGSESGAQSRTSRVSNYSGSVPLIVPSTPTVFRECTWGFPATIDDPRSQVWDSPRDPVNRHCSVFDKP